MAANTKTTRSKYDLVPIQISTGASLVHNVKIYINTTRDARKRQNMNEISPCQHQKHFENRTSCLATSRSHQFQWNTHSLAYLYSYLSHVTRQTWTRIDIFMEIPRTISLSIEAECYLGRSQFIPRLSIFTNTSWSVVSITPICSTVLHLWVGFPSGLFITMFASRRREGAYAK